MFISSSSQPKILTIYTYNFLVFYYFYYVLYNYLLYSSFLLSTLPTTLQVTFFCSFIKLNRFCVFVALILYIIWFLPTSFIDRLKFYVWSHLLVFFLKVNIASNIFVFLISFYMIICCWHQYFIMDLICYGFVWCFVPCNLYFLIKSKICYQTWNWIRENPCVQISM